MTSKVEVVVLKSRASAGPSIVKFTKPTTSKVGFNSIHIDTSIPEPVDGDSPDTIKAVYSTDLNILQIHVAIRARYAVRRFNIHVLQREIDMNKRLFGLSKIYVEQHKYKTKVDTFQAEVDDLNTGQSWSEYIKVALPILQSYIPLRSASTLGIVTIGKNVVTEKMTDTIVKERKAIIDAYCEIAAKHIYLDLTWTGFQDPSCLMCGAPSNKIDIDEETGLVQCECDFQRGHILKSMRNKDVTRSGTTQRGEYDERETFEKGVAKWEGRYPEEFPPDLEERLDKYLCSKGFPLASEIRKRPLNRKGRREGTSIALLCDTLGDMDLSEYYTSYNIIGHMYWGWRLPDIDAIRDSILDKYRRTQAAYEKIPGRRQSSLNFNIHLYLLLKSENYDCDRDDFKFLTSPVSLEYHHNMWFLMCEETGVKFTPLI